MAEEPDIDTSSLTLTVQRGPPTAASGHAHLQIVKDRTRLGVVLAGSRDVTILGRNSTMSHEVLEHPSISRRHAALVHNGDGDVFAADLGSTHGTYVNGCKIPSNTASRLSSGDVLKFGESSRCIESVVILRFCCCCSLRASFGYDVGLVGSFAARVSLPCSTGQLAVYVPANV